MKKTKLFYSLTLIIVSCIFFVSCNDDDNDVDQGTEKDANIVSFTFSGIEGKAVINTNSKTITAKAKSETDLTQIVAVFTLSPNAKAEVEGVEQISNITKNNFTTSVIYVVTSGDGNRTENWMVTITKDGDPIMETIAYNGYTYKIVKIGNQYWMAENLRTTKYNDGTDIPNVKDNDEWRTLTTGAYCAYDNDETKANTYGYLYNWHAINTGKLAPAGWRVATQSDWKTLVDYGTTDLKSISGWNENGNGTNGYGFNALPGGYRKVEPQSEFLGVGSHGAWMTSTEDSMYIYNNIHCFYFDKNSTALSGHIHKEAGFSIRCVRE